MTTRPPMRLQVALGNRLIAEAIFENGDGWGDARLAAAALARAKHAKGLPMGGAVIQRADLPRTWDVPVGSVIAPEEV